MKALKCGKYKEMIMEAVDGELAADKLVIVKTHLDSCKECREYRKTLENMAKLTSSLKVEAPAFIETRIMSKITGKDIKAAYNWFPVFSYAASFALIMFVSLFLIYSKAGNPSVDVASIDNSQFTIHNSQLQAVKHDLAVKPVVKQNVAKTDINPVEKAIPAVAVVPKQAAAAPVVQEQAAPSIAASVIKDGKQQTASAPAESRPASYGVGQVNTGAGSVSAADVAALKVTPVPTNPGLPLLDQDRAIVGNNLINPGLNQAARIVIKVDETARVVIKIFDKKVRVVAEILDEDKAAGTYEAYWYGKNDAGQTVSEGIYFVYIQIGKRVIKKNIIVTKD